MFSFKNETISNALRLAVIVSVIAMAWATALGQFASFVDTGETRKETAAVAACVPYEFPHAVIVDGKVYCYTTYWGTEYIIPLEYLQKTHKPTPTPDPG